MTSNAQQTETPARPPTPKLWASLAVALVAGAIAWGLLQAGDPVFKVPPEYHVPNIGAPAEKLAALQAAVNRTNLKNAMLYLATFGALEALALAALPYRVTGAAIALPIGLALGALAGWIGTLIRAAWVPPDGQADVTQTVLVQGLTLAAFGMGVGLAYGAAGRSLRVLLPALVGGLAAGGLAGVLYPIGLSVAMPAVNTEPLVPLEPISRLIWFGLVAGLLGVLIPLTAQRGRSPASPPGTSPG